jgi:flagellar hook protein FlgE
MSLYGMMRTSTSGMNAQANMLSTVADNIANASTVGYKHSSQEFSTLVLESGTAGYESGAVESLTRTFVSRQGSFNYTSSPTDLAISGNGFFVVAGPDDAIAMTRAGSFVTDGDGFLVNAAGYRLMAYPSANGQSPVVNGLAGLEPVNLSSLAMLAIPSTEGRLYVNLPPESAAVAAADLPSANAASSQFTRVTSLAAYDNIGAARTLDVYETKTAANTWEIAVFDRAESSPGGGFPYSAGPLATTTLLFDPATGALDGASATSIAVPVPNGATLNVDLSRSSELAAGYVVRDVAVNGSAPSVVERVSVGAAGEIYAIYSNGSRAESYRIPLANVPSPDNLDPVTGNVFALSAESGSLIVGLPQSGGLGELVASALEKSTVDVGNELTTMIQAQQSYTANSKVFQTAADLMDVLISLKR